MYGAPQEIAKKIESINTVFSEINEVFWPFFEFNKNRPAICNPRLFHIRRSFQRKPNQISTGRNDISAVTCHPLMEPRSQAPKAIRRLKRQLSLRPAGPMTPCESAPTLLITAAECSSSKQSWSIWQIMEGSCILISKLISSSSSVLGCEDANKELLNFSLSTCASHKNRIPKERATNQRVNAPHNYTLRPRKHMVHHLARIYRFIGWGIVDTGSHWNVCHNDACITFSMGSWALARGRDLATNLSPSFAAILKVSFVWRISEETATGIPFLYVQEVDSLPVFAK